MTIPTEEEDQIWTCRNYEPSKAYALFCIYRDMLSFRTIEGVIPEVGKRIELDEDRYDFKVPPLSTLLNYSAKWKWIERAEAYDD